MRSERKLAREKPSILACKRDDFFTQHLKNFFKFKMISRFRQLKKLSLLFPRKMHIKEYKRCGQSSVFEMRSKIHFQYDQTADIRSKIIRQIVITQEKSLCSCRKSWFTIQQKIRKKPLTSFCRSLTFSFTAFSTPSGTSQKHS